MASIVSCPACARALQVPDEYLGQTVQCPECKQTFEAQASSGAASVSSTPPTPPPIPPSEPEWDLPPPEKKRSSRRENRDDDDFDSRPIRRRTGSERPGKVQAVAIMTLVGGIYGIVFFLITVLVSGFICCLWPVAYYGLVMGIMATVKGSQLLGQDAARMPPPKGIAIMMICNIINADLINCVLGIINLVFLNDPEAEEFFRG